MKKLFIIILLSLYGLITYSQDTTVVIVKETVTKYYPEILFESEFVTIDTIDFDINEDTLFTSYSRWIRKDSIYVNQNRYRIIELQYRTNDQGIEQKKRRRILYLKETRIKRKIKH